jgi:hypothetical protein
MTIVLIYIHFNILNQFILKNRKKSHIWKTSVSRIIQKQCIFIFKGYVDFKIQMHNARVINKIINTGLTHSIQYTNYILPYFNSRAVFFCFSRSLSSSSSLTSF